jgi:hypothetical protein
MPSRHLLNPRFYLAFSLAIASTLVTNIVKAESTQSKPNIGELSQKIAKLIDLDPDRQSLITSALNRAIASKETSTETAEKVKTTIPLPIVRGRYIKPISPPQSIELGYLVKPKDKAEKTAAPNNIPNNIEK